ncbi:winged helix-turn-helix domain-containing protein, partial [Teredinibacter purpureus]|uniref:winged helix-turn-helix domain-containing protein n=1 Tax=Teredinibacter purpureus TaxID=2731756 RepID=UPI0005F780B5
MHQLSLFEHVQSTYLEKGGALDNQTLYSTVAQKAGLSDEELMAKSPIGKSKALRSKLKREIRWHQQTMKQAGWLESAGIRGVWELTTSGKTQLTKLKSRTVLIAFSTTLGIALWGDCYDAFENINEPISLCLTSPPYPIRNPRAYGKIDVGEYTDFICKSLEAVVKHLKPGGSIALNISNDIFLKGLPARSLYLEKLTIQISERFGLYLMDRLIWLSNKPPGPTYWASVNRVQLNTGYEPIL